MNVNCSRCHRAPLSSVCDLVYVACGWDSFTSGFGEKTFGVTGIRTHGARIFDRTYLHTFLNNSKLNLTAYTFDLRNAKKNVQTF